MSDFPTTQTLLMKIVKLKEQMDEGQPASKCILCSADILTLYELVSVQTTQSISHARPQHIDEPSSSSSSSPSSTHFDDHNTWYQPEMSEAIISVLSNTIMADIKFDLIAEYVKDKGCSPNRKHKQTALQWIRKGRGVHILDTCRGFLCTAVILLSVLSNIRGSNMIIADEVLDRLAVVPSMFLSIPSHSRTHRQKPRGTESGNNDLEVDRGQQKVQELDGEVDEREEEKQDLEEEIQAAEKQESATQSMSAAPHITPKQQDQALKILYGAMGEMSLPVITLYLRLLEKVAQKFKINDKICILTYEMCICALKLDSGTNPVADILDNSGRKLIVSLQKDAIDLLRAVFRTYPAHRAPIFQELFPVLSQVYSVKSPSKTFALGCSSLITTSATTSKMPMSLAALLTLIQCVAKFQSDSTYEGSSLLGAGESLLSSFNSVRQLANYFALELYQRCKKKEVGADFRHAMPKLFNDLLSVMSSPDWPAAPILLEALVFRLIKEISTNDSEQSNISGAKKDMTYCNQLLDILAIVGASFASTIKSQRITSNREDSIMLTAEVAKQATEKFQQQRSSWMTSLGHEKQNLLNFLETEVVSGGGNDLERTVGTKRASARISKGKKKNTEEQESEIKEMPMDADVTTKIEFDVRGALSVLVDITSTTVDLLAKHHLPMAPPPPMRVLAQCRDVDDIENLMPNISNLDLSRRIVLNFLELSSSSSSAHVRDAFTLTLAMWYQEKSIDNLGQKVDSDDDDNNAMKDYIIEMITSCSNRDEATNNNQFLNLTSAPQGNVLVHDLPTGEAFILNEYSHKGVYSYEFCSKLCKAVLTHKLIQKMYEGILSTILQLLISEPLPTIRARAMKSLHRLLKADPELIQRDTVRDIVTKKGLNDQAISVREESVKLVGTFVLFGYDISSMYLDGLMYCLNDKGVSVRKSVVNIFREVMLHQPNHPLYCKICRCLLVLGWDPKEEETIRDVVSSTFHKVWFSPPSETALSSTVKSLRKIDMTSKIETPVDLDIYSVDESEMESTSAADTSFSSMLTSSPPSYIETPEGCLELPNGWTSYVYPNSELHDKVICEPDSAAKTDSEDQFTPIKGDLDLDDNTSVEMSITKSNGNCNRVYISPSGTKYFSLNEVKDALLEKEEKQSERVERCHPTLVSASIGKYPLKSLQASTDSHVEVTCFQIVEVIHSLPDTENWMIKMIRDVLHGNKEGEDTKASEKKRRQESFLQCEKMVTILMEMLLQAEENNANIAKQLTRMTAQDLVVSTIVTLSVFCKAQPSLLSSHLHTLLPYLKCDNGLLPKQESITCLKIIEILSSLVILKDFSMNENRVMEVTRDLTQISLRYGTAQIDASIACMALLAEHITKDISPIIHLAEKCFTTIREISVCDRPVSHLLNQSQAAKVQRCLVVFGSICEHTRKFTSTLQNADQDDDTVAKTDLQALPSFLPQHDIIGACYSCCMFGLELKNEAVHMKALQALCSVYIGNPRLILLTDKEGMIEWIFSSHFSNSVHRQFLISLRHMMMAEEERLEVAAAIENMEKSGISASTKSSKVEGTRELDSDATIAGFVLQQHLPKIKKFLSDPVAITRLSAVKLVGTLLRQGMLCPLDVLGHLVALQGDRIIEVRQESLLLLQIEDEKFTNFLDNRIVEGIELCSVYQTRIFGENEPVVEGFIEDDRGVTRSISVFHELYKSCLQQTRKRRNDMIAGIFRRYEILHNCIEDCASKLLNSPTKKKSSSERRDTLATLGGNNNDDTDKLPKIQRKQSHLMSDIVSKMKSIDFLISTVAYLPFEYIEEPLTAIHWINKAINVGSNVFLGEMKNLLLHTCASQRVEGAMQPPLLMSSRGDSRKNTSSPSTSTSYEDTLLFASDKFDAFLQESNEEFHSLLHALALKLLQCHSHEMALRLKKFLKAYYILTNDKCQNFDPRDRMFVDKVKLSSVGTARFDGCKYNFEMDEILSFLNIKKGDNEHLLSTKSSIIENGALKKVVLTVIGDYNRLSMLIDSDSQDDYTVIVKKTSVTAKRKVKTGASSVNSSSPSSASSPMSTTNSIKSNKSSKKKKKTQSKRLYGSKRRKLSLEPKRRSEENDDYDEDKELMEIFNDDNVSMSSSDDDSDYSE